MFRGFLCAAFVALPALATAQTRPVTFHEDVVPVLQKHCQSCHRPGEAAPFSMLTYKDARPWAASMKRAVVSRKMPPWHADPAVGHFGNDRRLSQAGNRHHRPMGRYRRARGRSEEGARAAGLPRRLEHRPTRQDSRDAAGIQRPGRRDDRLPVDRVADGARQGHLDRGSRGAAGRSQRRAPRHRVLPQAGIQVAGRCEARDPDAEGQRRLRGRHVRRCDRRLRSWSAGRAACSGASDLPAGGIGHRAAGALQRHRQGHDRSNQGRHRLREKGSRRAIVSDRRRQPDLRDPAGRGRTIRSTPT